MRGSRRRRGKRDAWKNREKYVDLRGMGEREGGGGERGEDRSIRERQETSEA